VASCLFCGIGTQTKEDALPKWVWRHLDVRGDVEIRRQSDGGLVRQTRRPDFRVGGPCASCNSGWMSKLEESFVAVGGARLVAGDPPVILEPEQAAVVARWSMKTALMLHEAFAYQTGRVAVPDSHYRALMNGAPPPGTFVYIGGVNADGRDINSLRPMQLDQGEEPLAYVMAASIGYLVVTVAASVAPRAIWQGPLPMALQAHLVQVWPTPTEPISWPPSRDLTVESFDAIWRAVIWTGVSPARSTR
jgi:hypothetical protein